MLLTKCVPGGMVNFGKWYNSTFIFKQAFQIFLVSVKLSEHFSGSLLILWSLLNLLFLFLHQTLNSSSWLFSLPRIFRWIKKAFKKSKSTERHWNYVNWAQARTSSFCKSDTSPFILVVTPSGPKRKNSQYFGPQTFIKINQRVWMTYCQLSFQWPPLLSGYPTWTSVCGGEASAHGGKTPGQTGTLPSGTTPLLSGTNPTKHHRTKDIWHLTCGFKSMKSSVYLEECFVSSDRCFCVF